ncbi:delta(1)-pyrroline-2-carboxylate reductase family protein [Polaromonas sp.]|uniref:delta(1)-pyrroline-2-carboxylate reductase family protein n=1 Tax=Polaromonas sp. TaxID=1869339 RepID=UPI003267EF65
MNFLDAAETARLLPYELTADALAAMLLRQSAGRAFAPVRQSFELPGGAVLLLMPARDDERACVKLVTVHPGNADRGLPVIHGEVVLMDAHDGHRILILDGPTVTARRTAAMSLLGAKRLATAGSHATLMIGSGVQARHHLDAFAQNGLIRRLYVHSLSRSGSEALVTQAKRYGIDAKIVDDPSQVASEVGLIVTATTSSKPVLHGPVSPDCTIIALGAYRPGMAEIAPSLIETCDVYVDTLEGAREEAGDLLQANIDWSRVIPIEQVHERAERTGRPILFKTVGHALWDLAAATLAHESSQQLTPRKTP